MTTMQTITTIEDLQKAVGEWSDRQPWSPQPAENPLGGIFEELGELTRSVLKMNQGIRGSAEQHMADARDAIGDTFIYSMNFAHEANLTVRELWSSSIFEAPSLQTCLRTLAISYGKLCEGFNDFLDLESHQTSLHLTNFLILLNCLALRMFNETALQIAIDTFSKVVSKRDFNSRQDGGNHTHNN